MRAIGLCIVCAGCGTSAPTDECAGDVYEEPVETVSVAYLPGLRPSGGYDGAHRHLELGLYYNGSFVEPFRNASPPIGDGNDEYCAELPADTSANLDGLPVAVETRGSWGCFGPSGPGCISPVFSVTVPDDFAPTVASIVIADRGSQLEVGVGDLLLPRVAIPTGNPDWSFQQGQVVTLVWSPASDLALTDAEVDFTTTGVGFTIDSGFVRGASTISFTLPRFSGTGTMRVSLAGQTGGWYATQVVEHAASIN